MKLREGENADLQVFLMDNAMLFVKQKWAKNVEQLKVFRSPIPLDMLVLLVPEEEPETTRGKRNQKGSTPAHVPPKPDGKYGYLIQVQRLGRKAFSMPLWVETHASRKKWLQLIEKQQLAIAQHVFTTETINNDFFGGLRGANCISPYDHGNRMIYGTDEGVYFSNLRDPKLRSPVKVINLPDVTQVDVLEEFQLLIVLHERTVNAYPLDCLDPNDPNAALKKGKRIASHTSFFKTGTCLGRTLVVVVKSSTLSSTIKVLEPNVPGARPQGGLFRSRQAQEPLKVFKEFYIPLESFNVHFLKTKLCVGCSRGFEIVDLTTLDMQSLLDPADPEVKKITSPTVTNKPMAMFRVEGDFLLCFDDVAFFINKNGWRSRAPWFVRWEGQPTAFGGLERPQRIETKG
jgi:hypothetical protein